MKEIDIINEDAEYFIAKDKNLEFEYHGVSFSDTCSNVN